MHCRHTPPAFRRGWRRTPAWALTAIALATLALAAGAQTAPPPGTLPQGAQVQAGAATLQQNGTLLTIQQTSDKLVTNWQRFDIGADATVRFLQPGRDSVALNRVLSQEPSAVFGRLQANGQVFLLNPSGVLFGATARVDVGGLVASSLALADADFLAGRHRFNGTATSGAVQNAGHIQAAEGGYVAFLAPRVLNSGQIMAPQGDVVLAAGNAASLDFVGDRLLHFTLDQGTVAALVDQQGLVQAEGGRVLLSARAADAALRAVVNQGGVVDASSLVARGGRIVLEADEITLAPGSQTLARGATGGGQVLVGGGWGGGGAWRQAQAVTLASAALVDARATIAGPGGEVVLWSDVGAANSHTVVDGLILAGGAGGAGGASHSGGRVETSGHRLDVRGTVDAGPGGLWLLDPVDITITTSGNGVPPGGGTYGGAGNVLASSIVTALNNGNSVVLDTSGAGASQGDITVATDLITGAMAADATLTLKANRHIIVNAGADIDATGSSNTHKLNLVLWADQDGSGGGAIQLGATGATQTLIRTNGGGLWLGGGSGSSSWTPSAGAPALTVGNGAAIGTDASGTGWGLAAYGTQITTAGGHVQGRGRSEKNSGASDVALGISLQGSSISSGAGDITLAGEVANTSGTTVDITLGLTAHSGTTLASTSGHITLTGTLDASTRTTRGAGLWLGTQLGAVAATGDVSITSGTGAISLTGSGSDAAGTGFRHGLMLRNQFSGDDILLRSTSGAITLDGQASYRAAIDVTTGLQLQNDTTGSSLQVVSQTGAITLRGSNTQDSNFNENDLRLQLSDSAGGLRIGFDGSTAYSGAIVIEADALYQSQQAGAGAIAVQGSGSLTIRPAGSSFTQLRAGVAGTLTFDDDWAFGTGLGGFTLGKAGNTTALTLSNALSVAGPVQVIGGALALNAALTTTGDLLLQSTGDITQAAGVAVATQGGSAVYRADSDGSGAGMVYLKDGASLSTAGGHIWMGGGAGSTTWNGLTVGDGFATGGTVIPKAELLTTVADDFKNGITLYNASLDSGGGDIALFGRSGSGSDVYGYMGVYLGYGASVRAGAGDITVQGQASGGTSSSSTGWHYGVLMLPTGNNGSSHGTTTVETTSGAVQITASAQHDQAANHSAGLALFTQNAAATAQVLSTSGDITLSGQNLNASNPSYGGILATGSGRQQVLSQTGAITLIGSSANSAVSGLNLAAGTRIGSDGSSAASGDITLTADSLTLASTATLQSSGSLTLSPSSAGTTVGLGGGSGVLSVPATAFSSSFVDGFSQISIGRADGTGALTVGSLTAGDALLLRSGSGGITISGTLVANAALTLQTTTGLSGSGNVQLGSGQAMAVTQAGDSDYAGVISGSGASLGKAGAGRLTLSGDHSFSGSTTVSAGTLQLGNGGSSGSLAGAIANDATLVVDRSNDLVLAGVISGSGTLTKNGGGTLELAAANTYSGGSTVNAGRLYGGEGSEERTAFGSGPITVASGATLWLDRGLIDNPLVLAGGTLLGSNGFGEVVRGDVTLMADSSVDSSFNITFAGSVTGSGRLTLANTWRDEGELRITGSATHSGGTVLDHGVLNIGAGGSTGSVAGSISTTATSGVVFQRSDNITHAGSITGAGTVQQQGGGTLTLGNHVAHTGATVVASGTLVWTSDAPVFGTSGVSGAGRLVVQPASSSFSSPLDLGSLPTLASDLGGLQVGSASNTTALTLAGAVAISGDITLLGGPLTLASGASLSSSDGDITLSTSRFVNQAGASALVAGGSGRHWQVWSHNADPFNTTTGDVRGGLAFDYKQYGASHGSSPVLGSGNGFLYTLAPALTVTLTGVSKVYDGSPTVTVDGSHFAASGVVDGDSLVLSTPTSATFTGAGGQNAGSGKAVLATGVGLVGASQGGATAYGYSLASSTASGSDAQITPAALTLAGSRVYDGSTVMAGSTLTATGVNGESFALTGSGASGNLSAKHVQTAQPLASVAGLALGSSNNGGLAGNYQALSVSGSSVSVTVRSISLAGITAADKVYDGGMGAVVSGGTFTGLVNGDDVTLSSTGSFGDKHVGTGKTVALVNVFGGADLGNYSVADQASTTASITPKALTLSGIVAADKVYDGGTTASVSGGTFSGLVNGDDVSVASSGGFADKHVGAGKGVSLVNLFAGADLGNYSVTDQTSTTASITPKAIMLSGITAADKVYDGGTVASVSGGVFSGLVNGDDVSVASSGSFADKHVGSSKTVALVNTLGGADLGNYSVTDQTSTTASIAPKALTLSGIVAADKVYDGGTTVAVSGGLFTGLVTGDALTVSSTGSFTDKHAGTGKTVTLVNVFGGTDLGNYSVSAQGTTTASISPKTLTLSGIVAADKVYDGGTSAAVSGGLFTGLVTGDALTFSSTGSFTDKHAGTGKTVTLVNAFGGADLGNYSVTDQTTTTASITPKALTLNGIVAADKSYDGGTSASVSGGVFDGLVNGDVLTLISSGSFADKHVATGKTVALVNTLGGADVGNYSITEQTSTTASITPKAITLGGITASDKVYDGDTSVSVSGGVFDGLVNGDELTLISSGSFADKHVATGKTVALVNTLGGADVGNYSITEQTSTTASITPKATTLSDIVVADKVYDGASTATVSGGVINGLLDGDVLIFSSTGSFTDKHVGTGKTVTLVNLFEGADRGNYNITEQTSTTASITPKAITLSGIVAADKVYDGSTTTSVSGGLFEGLVNGDELTLISIGRFADKNVGSGKTVALTTVFGGADLGNYSISAQAAASASIMPRALNLHGITAADKVYDGGTAASVSGGLFDGLVAGDQVTFSSSGHFGDKNAGTGKAVALVNTLGGADLGNYSVSIQNQAVASITPRPLTLVLTAQDKVYDGQTTAQVQVQDNRVAGDNLLLAAEAQFANRHVGTGKAVSVQLAPLGGADAANYRLLGGDTANATASITQRASVTWVGTPGGDWMDATQWADGALPDFANVAQVLLPDGATPRLASGTVQLDSLLGAGATLALAGGQLATGPAMLGGLQHTGGSWRVAGDAQLGSAQASLLLGDLRVTGTLTLAAPGGTVAMADNAALQIAGAVHLQAGSATLVAGGPLLLGTLAVSGDLQLRSTGALNLGQGSVGGVLDAASGGSDVTQTGALVVVAGTAIDAGRGAVSLPQAGNHFTGPVHIVGAGGVQVRGAEPDGLAAVRDASSAALAAAPPAAEAGVPLPPITVFNTTAPGHAVVVERLPLSLQDTTATGGALDFELIWTGTDLQLRPRSAAAAAMADSRRADLVALALRTAQARWGLAPGRITTVYLLP
ncbi:MAG: filamentous hemagglutinin N-terminal domain-containing protein [Rubrivivax sp.]|nr:filamentous hemagglutinin N-terminal domain-containing protein [Rubrivivax sp.]